MKNYKEFIINLVESEKIKFSESKEDGVTTLKAVIKYSNEGINTDYLISRSFTDENSENHYEKFAEQIHKTLKTLD